MSMVIGLTGGIACGKSTVSQYLIELGYVVIDADLIARQVVAKGTKGLKQIIQCFGQEYLMDNQELDRKKLGKLVFNNQEELNKLNKITAQLINDKIEYELFLNEDRGIVILDMPLLIEHGYVEKVDEVWLVIASKAQQIERMQKRDGLSNQDALARINCQMSTKEKMKQATVIIDNSGLVEDTYHQVERSEERRVGKEC